MQKLAASICTCYQRSSFTEGVGSERENDLQTYPQP